MDNNQVILLLTNKDSEVVINLYQKLIDDLPSGYDVFLLYHSNDGFFPRSFFRANLFVFTDDQIYEKLGCRPAINREFLKGNAHFPLMLFMLDHPNYNNYWLIEDDVRFTGDWSVFFNSFDYCSQDLLASQIFRLKDGNKWAWANYFYFNDEEPKIPMNQRISSLCSIYRLSNRAVHYIYSEMKRGYRAHYELLYPTLLNAGGYSIGDFGGEGEFVLNGFKNRFYLSEIHEEFGFGYDGTTNRFLPLFKDLSELTEPNMIYHPVKIF